LCDASLYYVLRDASLYYALRHAYLYYALRFIMLCVMPPFITLCVRPLLVYQRVLHAPFTRHSRDRSLRTLQLILLASQVRLEARQQQPEQREPTVQRHHVREEHGRVLCYRVVRAVNWFV
jgi:hypothetical protein